MDRRRNPYITQILCVLRREMADPTFILETDVERIRSPIGS